MQVRAEQIETHLQQGLKSVYLITGEEPLQVMEVADAVRKQAQVAGFTEREVLTVDHQFDWGVLLEASEALSLFSSKKLLDMRWHSCKIGAAGSKALQQYLSHLPSDKILLIQCFQFEKSCRNAAWFKAIAQEGVTVQVWALSAAQTQAWVAARMRAAGLQADDEAVRYLAERIEGNLLAAAQEIHKLQLLHTGGVLTVEHLAAVIADSSRFKVFDLAEAILAQDIKRLHHILAVLREEDTPLPLLVWALGDLLHQLNEATELLKQNRALQPLLARMPRNRQTLFQNAAKRMMRANWAMLFRRVALLDQHSKGVGEGVSSSQDRLWDAVFDVALAMSGKRLFG
ncbi:MAG: DNA polymerase III subunit delta [Proteobacteria bacterium]|nr:MAG: DNA polymerase III subunit delta [Pseudomonadota bacterium]